MASKNGQITFNCGLVVPADKAEEVEKVLSMHEGWMRENHSLDADGKIHLVDYYVTKSEQLNNPLDPNEGTTGNILYSVNETYVCLLYTSPSPRDRQKSRMPSSA